MQIRVYEKGHRPPEFYAHVGPVVLQRAAIKELHDPQYGGIYDEPYGIWFVALDDAGALLGFCALFDREKELFLDHCYVVPEHRGKGVGKHLFAQRLEYARGIQGTRKVKGITMNPVQYQVYLNHGFRLASKRGKYYWMELAATDRG